MSDGQNALIFKIDRLNTHNGPGYRTVIYFKGCPLHCAWCHNPEGISPKKEIWWHAAKCIGCGRCVEACPNRALALSDKGIRIDRAKCLGCYRCAEACPTGAIQKLGIEYSIDELMRIILKDKAYFDSSGGGVTVTGGEPGTQAPFLALLFEQCRKEGINTALDTSGMFSIDGLEKLLPLCDMFFLDIKLLTQAESLRYTGMPIDKLHQVVGCLGRHYLTNNLPRLEIRTPLVPGATDNDDNLEAIASLIKKLPKSPEIWELCMFNDLCEDKYLKLGKDWIFCGKKHTRDDYHRFLNFRDSYPDIPIKITGFIEATGQPPGKSAEVQ